MTAGVSLVCPFASGRTTQPERKTAGERVKLGIFNHFFCPQKRDHASFFWANSSSSLTIAQAGVGGFESAVSVSRNRS